jgi:hypothetical protein
MNTEHIIIEEFRKDIDSEGLFWRINRPNTFIDLLMLESYKATIHGVNMSIAIKVVIISVKAIINDRYGMLDYRLDFREINEQVLSEKDNIFLNIKEILTENKSSFYQSSDNLSNSLDYFKVLNNLKIDNYSVQVFKDILKTFLVYIEANI